MRIRSIKPEFWTDQRFSRMPVLPRLVFLCLISMADDEGRIEADPETVMHFGFPREDSRALASALDILTNTGRIVMYESNGQKYIALPTWNRHQKIDHASKSKLPEPPIASLANPRESSRILAPDQGSGIRDQGMDQGGVPPDPPVASKPKRVKQPENIPPTLEEVSAYCAYRKAKGKPPTDPEAFIAYYEKTGWKVKGQQVVSWKACVVTFEKNAGKFGPPKDESWDDIADRVSASERKRCEAEDADKAKRWAAAEIEEARLIALENAKKQDPPADVNPA